MSKYENYNCVCSDYDGGRRAVGMELYRAFLSSNTSLPFSKIHVLDAGCGTGNYSVDLLRHGVGRVTMLDASEGMLSLANAKVVQFQQERYDTVRSNLPELPFEDATFDAVMINFVIHHLDGGGDTSFSIVKRTFESIYRVLKPGGILLVQTLSYYQLQNCYWMFSFLPDRVLKAFFTRLPTIQLTKNQIKEVGFDQVLHYAPVDETLMTPETHFDFEGILRKEWRNMLSVYDLLTTEETDAMMNEVQVLIDNGTFQDRVNKCEDNRKNSGEFTILVASKPQNIA